ncbi:hypothetical protein BIZ70_gp056 [Gordonia phage JSwag]|nr:hypothetical protein BIZ70_gp056 [Gordonia phage JSwag]AOE44467.1 hypothetical protein SEA_JSWAG_57 [Gordonia phage JSwag]
MAAAAVILLVLFGIAIALMAE